MNTTRQAFAFALVALCCLSIVHATVIRGGAPGSDRKGEHLRGLEKTLPAELNFDNVVRHIANQMAVSDVAKRGGVLPSDAPVDTNPRTRPSSMPTNKPNSNERHEETKGELYEGQTNLFDGVMPNPYNINNKVDDGHGPHDDGHGNGNGNDNHGSQGNGHPTPAGTTPPTPAPTQAPTTAPTSAPTGSNDLTSATTASQNGIYYRGGAVMNSAPALYLIFYGNFTGSTTPDILINLVSNLNQNAYYRTLTTYYQVKSGATQYISTYPTFGGAVYDTTYSIGMSIDDTGVYNIVARQIAQKKLPLSDNAIYFVVTDAQVQEITGFCTAYCGWHYSDVLSNVWIKYSFIGSPNRCPRSCSSQSLTPNGNLEADAASSILMHELVETASDPNVNAWYDASGYENADKCAWKYGTVYKSANGAYANMRIGSRDYLIQQNWVNANAGYCALAYP